MDSDRKKEMQGEHVLAAHSPNPCQSFLYYYSWGFVGSGRKEKYKDNMFGEAFSQPLKKVCMLLLGVCGFKAKGKMQGQHVLAQLAPSPGKKVVYYFWGVVDSDPKETLQ